MTELASGIKGKVLGGRTRAEGPARRVQVRTVRGKLHRPPAFHPGEVERAAPGAVAAERVATEEDIPLGHGQLVQAIPERQVVVGIANVLLQVPVEITGLHSALAAGLICSLGVSVREVWRASDPTTNSI